MGMRDYHDMKDIIIPEAQEKIMDICCAAWDDCRDIEHCKDCPDRQMLKEKFSLLECFSLKYSRMLLEAGYAPVVHGRWETNPDDIYWGNTVKRKYCTACKKEPHFDREKREFILTDYCPNCGAKMDGGKT